MAIFVIAQERFELPAFPPPVYEAWVVLGFQNKQVVVPCRGLPVVNDQIRKHSILAEAGQLLRGVPPTVRVNVVAIVLDIN